MDDKLWTRFFKKIMPEPNTGCWLWSGAPYGEGYGSFMHKGVIMRAHRFSYLIHKGEIPDGLHVLHTCDVRCCVNPDHLFLGTNIDNINDKIKKGRQANGASINNSKLVGDQVMEIVSLYNSGNSIKSISKIFNITTANLYYIVSGITWGHLTKIKKRA